MLMGTPCSAPSVVPARTRCSASRAVRARRIGIDGDVRIQLGIERLDALEAGVDKFNRRDGSPSNEVGEAQRRVEKRHHRLIVWSECYADGMIVTRARQVQAFAAATALMLTLAGNGPSAQAPPAIQFESVTSKAGLTTRLDQNATPDKNMVETMAGGLAVFDYDGDGLPDIFFTNGAQIPSLTKRGPEQWNRLFRNRGGMAFEDVTARAGIAGEGYSTGAAAADYDNDGRVDLFVAGVNAQPALSQSRRRHVRRRHRPPAASRPTPGRSPPAGSTTTTTAGSICSSSTTSTGRRSDNKFCGDQAAASASTVTRSITRACRTRCIAIAATARSRTCRRNPESRSTSARG